MRRRRDGGRVPREAQRATVRRLLRASEGAEVPRPRGSRRQCYTGPMSVAAKTVKALRAAEALLHSAPQGKLDSLAVEKHVRKALRLLASEEPQWVDIGAATRLLGVLSEETPLVLARLGLLRSRPRDDGQIEVRLDDVLYRRLQAEGLLGFGGEDLTPEDLELLHWETPGSNPWEREQIRPSA